MTTVHVLHGEGAIYPSLQPYSEYLTALGYDVSVQRWGIPPNEIPDVAWCIMGYYPRRPKAGRVIHDYRSLSLHPFREVKDGLKRWAQQKPDLRIFQSPSVRDVMGFHDGVPSVILPTCIPSWVWEIDRSPRSAGNLSFVYLGSMTRERQFDSLLRSFGQSDWCGRSEFVLIGEPEPSIHQEFQGTPGLRFAGRMAHREGLELAAASDVAICYFPVNHRQPPTKLLEYAALGMPTICNAAPESLAIIREFGLECTVVDGFIFEDLKDPARGWTPIDRNRIRAMEWGAKLESCGLREWLSAKAPSPRLAEA
jgi:hypothetical protein